MVFRMSNNKDIKIDIGDIIYFKDKVIYYITDIEYEKETLYQYIYYRFFDLINNYWCDGTKINFTFENWIKDKRCKHIKVKKNI